MNKQRESQGPKPYAIRAGDAAAVAGEIAGGVIGIAAGPAGALAGMAIGALAGTVVGAGLEAEERRAHAHERELDEAIGLQDGDIGAAKPGAPAARIGAFSAGSSGVAPHGPSPAEGPIQDLDVDD
jgi:hypothetical protein